MSRGKIRNELWWDTKTSFGKTPKQIVKTLGKEIQFTEHDVKRILTRYLVLQDKKFFKKGVSTLNSILACTYLCSSTWMLGREPISPWKFIKYCKKNRFKISYSVLMKQVRKAKKAGLFTQGPSCAKFINRYRRRLIYKFKMEPEILEEIQVLVDEKSKKMEIAGNSPQVAAAGFTYICTRKNNLPITQEQLCDFFGISEVSLRTFWTKHRNTLN